MSKNTIYIPPLNTYVPEIIKDKVAKVGLREVTVCEIMNALVPENDRRRNQLWILLERENHEYIGATEISAIDLTRGKPNVGEFFRVGLLHNASRFFLATVKPVDIIGINSEESEGKMISSEFEFEMYKNTRDSSNLLITPHFGALIMIGKSGSGGVSIEVDRQIIYHGNGKMTQT